MPTLPELPFDLAAAVSHLSGCDPSIARLVRESAPFDPSIDHAQSPYEALAEAIAYQSISGKAAATIFARIKALSASGGVPTPNEMLKLNARALRKAGLSGAKILAMKDLAQKTIDGIVPTHEEALKLSDEELVKRLISVRGIGAWTVEMFLIFRLGRPDVLPVHDLGVKKGWSIAYGKKHMPRPKELLAFGERWRPYRTVASWYMWRAFERAGYAATNKIRPPKLRRKRTQSKHASVNPDPSAGIPPAASDRSSFKLIHKLLAACLPGARRKLGLQKGRAEIDACDDARALPVYESIQFSGINTQIGESAGASALTGAEACGSSRAIIARRSPLP
jgi:DNA-3-methyladenine glycosylase II